MADDRVKEIRDKHLDEYISDDIQTLLSEIDRLQRTPEKLQCFMDMLLKEARKWSLKELMEDWNIDPEADYNEIKEWFKNHGIQF